MDEYPPKPDTAEDIQATAISDEPAPTIYSRSDHSISRKGIDPDALRVMYRLMNADFKAYLVGGGVRDLLLGKAPKDFDIATDATPRQVKSLFRNCRIIGRRFKLAHVFFPDNKIIEVSTFRDAATPVVTSEADEEMAQNSATDNRYGTERTDAFRRDLSINGLFYDLASFSVIDYVGGVSDLNNKLIRLIGDPDDRLIEDPVRMIRVARHAARAQFSIEESTWNAVLRQCERIQEASQVRVFEEIRKDVLCGRFLDIVRLLAQAGVLEFIAPELTANRGALLTPEHPFSTTLKRIDEALRQGAVINSATIFALIALFTDSPSLVAEDAWSRFPTQRDVREHIARCFPKLAFPRRERERVESIVWTVAAVLSNAKRYGRLLRLGSEEHRSDCLAILGALVDDAWLRSLGEILAGDPSADEDVFDEDGSEDGLNNGDEEPRRRRRRRRRRPRRGPLPHAENRE